MVLAFRRILESFENGRDGSTDTDGGHVFPITLQYQATIPGCQLVHQWLLLRTSESSWLFGAVVKGRVCVWPGVQILENCQIDDCEVAPDDKGRALSVIIYPLSGQKYWPVIFQHGQKDWAGKYGAVSCKNV